MAPISAYVPVYNNAATIQATLLSIMSQTRPVDELFVIDDGSTDGSAEIAQRLGVRVIKQRSNLGRGAARARAMQEASHELVVCCDATNVLDSQFVANSLHWFEDEQIAAVFGRITQPNDRSAAHRWRGRHLFKHARIFPYHEFNGSSCIHKVKLITYGAVARKSAIMAAGNYDQRCRHSEDRDLGERLLARGCDVVFDPNLILTSIAKNSVAQVLERYARWHGPSVRVSWYVYLRLVYYSIKCMAAQDLKDWDFLSVPITLLCPHVQFWRAYFSSGNTVLASQSNKK